jgi:UDP-N-acetylmuramate dehydrogenase
MAACASLYNRCLGRVEPFYPLVERLKRIARVQVQVGAPLAGLTRFGIGGPAAVLVEARSPDMFAAARQTVADAGVPWIVLGDGTNVVVADRGFDGVVLRYAASRISRSSDTLLAEAGAPLQRLVDHSIQCGLAGIHTMTGIPGWVGAAVYGNAGAYGRSICQSVERVRFFDGRDVRTFGRDDCRFDYRESVFKKRREWTVLDVMLRLVPGDPAALASQAHAIRAIRDEKYPPAMRCAGSIFKNCLIDRLPPPAAGRVPPDIVREGKVPSAWFLEKVGAKGQRRGGIQVARYHANLIYNDANGTAADLRFVIADLKRRVRDEFGFDLEEEVQYVGFDDC